MKKRVLVVEDEDKLRRILELQLVDSGFEVEKASTAEEALPLIDRADLILTDFKLPGMTGFEMLQIIRRMDSHVPVIVMTAYGTVENNEIHELRGGLFDAVEYSGRHLPVAEVNLLAPCEPPKILAVGLNYRSHLGDRKVPGHPELAVSAVRRRAGRQAADIDPRRPTRHARHAPHEGLPMRDRMACAGGAMGRRTPV